MNHFTPKQRAEIVTLYIENSHSVVLTQRACRRKYRGIRAPCDNNTIRHLIVNMLFVNDQNVPLNWLKRSGKALPKTQKCRVVATLSSLAIAEPLCGVF
nr:unnamed protein product [Callosobruchus analis]